MLPLVSVELLDHRVEQIVGRWRLFPWFIEAKDQRTGGSGQSPEPSKSAEALKPSVASHR
jgi:hypothetical protein